MLVFLTTSPATGLSRRRVLRLTYDNLMRCNIEAEQEDHDFCLSCSHYTDTDSASRVQALAGIKSRDVSQNRAFKLNLLSASQPKILDFQANFNKVSEKKSNLNE